MASRSSGDYSSAGTGGYSSAGTGGYSSSAGGYYNYGSTGGYSNSGEARDRDPRDVLRFLYQTGAKGHGKSYQQWFEAWKQCMLLSRGVTANSREGALTATSHFKKIITFIYL